MKKAVLSFAVVGMAGLLISASAQPGPGDYASFSRFITTRDIFDPNRPQHNTPLPQQPGSQPQVLPNEVRLVGTMSYDKGLFAFFNGNNTNLNRVLRVGDKIAGYTLTEITRNFVELATTDKNTPSELTIGGALREKNGEWVPASADSTPATPPLATGQNDVLKRLMEQREKENQ